MPTRELLEGLRRDLTRRLLIDEDHACFSLEPQALEAILCSLQAGTDVAKYGQRGQPLTRRLRLSASRDSVYYEGATRKELAERTLLLRDVDCVLQGQHTSLFSAAKRKGHVVEACCLSLISASGKPRKSLDVAFPTAALAQAWHTGLTALLIALRISEEDSDTRALRRAFGAACARAGSSPLGLPLGSVSSILPQGLGQRLAAKDAKVLHMLSAAQRDVEDSAPPVPAEGAPLLTPPPAAASLLSLPEVLHFVNVARGEEREDIRALYSTLLSPPSAQILTVPALAAFLRASQGWLEASEEDARQLCLQWEREPLLALPAAAAPLLSCGSSSGSGSSGSGGSREHPSPAPSGMSLRAFAAWLTSSFNSALAPAAALPASCDMSQPLASYWIESSHNTYLEAGQLFGPSSTAPYLYALSCGCRCLELDVWDGAGGEPRVYHGRTLTTAVSLRDVALALADNAFRRGTMEAFPLILSLEMHACAAQQQRVADILIECFGARLPFYDSEEGASSATLPQLPSPLQLQGRVIIKSKLKVAKAADAVLLSPPLSHPAPPPPPLSHSLLSLVYLRGVPWRQLLEPAQVGPAAASPFLSAGAPPSAPMEADARVMASLKDGKLEALLRQQHAGQAAMHSTPPSAHPPRTDISRITQTHLLRVYPGPLHFDSSNFIPCRFWAQGVQMTALNYQTQDTCLRLQRAWFKQNGRCGYVLKPAYLRAASPAPSPTLHLPPLCTSAAPSPISPLPTALAQGMARGGSGVFAADAGSDVGAAGAAGAELDKRPLQGTAPQAALCLTLHGAQNLPCGSGASPLHWLQWTVSVYGHPLDEQKVRLRPVARVNDACVWAAGSWNGNGSGSGSGGGGGGEAGLLTSDLSGAQGGSTRAATSPAQLMLPLHHPAVACLYIELHGHGDAGAKGSGAFLAYAALPLPSARVGFRGLSLRNAAGKKLPLCTLLCNFQRR